MNIFVLDYNIEKNVQYHVDKHVVKMILESAQLLSSAVRMSGIDAGYKLTHKNHPCAIWARESIHNWLWLKEFTYALQEEWRYRFDHPYAKWHKSAQLVSELPEPDLPDIGMTAFKQCMPEKFKDEDVVTAYRNYYKVDKAHLQGWKHRSTPYWW